MQSEHPLALLVGRDSDLLFLRSAVLASVGIWSMRVETADQAIALLSKVPCDLAVICYTLNEPGQEQMLSYLFSSRSSVRLLWLVPGDDCSGTEFLMKVEDALEELPPLTAYTGEPQAASPA